MIDIRRYLQSNVFTRQQAEVLRLIARLALTAEEVAMPTPNIAIATAGSGAAASLSIAAPPSGERHYISKLTIERFATAALVAGAAPVLVTTTNLPGGLTVAMPADAAGAGSLFVREAVTGAPMVAVSSAATTIDAPATTNVIWRIVAHYYTGP